MNKPYWITLLTAFEIAGLVLALFWGLRFCFFVFCFSSWRRKDLNDVLH